MDHGPEATHGKLVEVGLPSTIADMKNPTEEYILTLITQFLTKFGIDVNAIRKPTFEQLNLSLVEDNPEIISLVNLSEAMASFSRKIFLKEFHLTDITNPVPKRSRKIANFLANFLLYATNKMVEIEEKLEETRLKYEHLQELRNQRMTLIEAKNAQALRIAEKLELNEQLRMEIAKLKKRKEERKSRIDDAEKRLKDAKQEKMEAAQRHRNLTTQAMKTKQKLEDINSKVVRSPERHNALLRDTIERKKQQSEKRAVLQEAAKSKKPAIEQIESCLSFVRQEHAKFPEVIEAYKRFAEMKKVMERTEKKAADLNSLIEREANAGTEEGNQINNAAVKEAEAESEEHLSAIRKKQKELSTEKKVLEKKMEDSKIRLQEILSKRDEIRASIVKKEAECKEYVKNCQELYDAEIKMEREMSINLDKTLERNLENQEVSRCVLNNVTNHLNNL